MVRTNAKNSSTKRIRSKLGSSSKEQNETINRSRRKSKPKKKFCIRTNGDGGPFQMSAKIYKEIRMLQQKTKNIIPVAPFLRLIKEILYELGGSELRVQRSALYALQESCEMYMTQYFEDSYLAAVHANRATLMVKDMRFIRRIRGVDDIINH